MDGTGDKAGMSRVEAVRYGDNFAYLLSDPAGAACAVIDPGDAGAVRRALEAWRLQPVLLLATHGHRDHTAGAGAVARRAGCAPLRLASGGETVALPWGGVLQAMSTPGHTADHVVYLDPDGSAFTGDTLFVAGCGRLMGRDPAVMWSSLERLAALPAGTRIYPGHDYTAENLAFAAHLDPDDTTVAARLAHARAGDPLVPSTMDEELRTNPFLRCADPGFRARIGLAHLAAEACFAELRRRKDRW